LKSHAKRGTPSAAMAKAVITGASGFIGGRLRDSLLADGWDVVALVRKGSPEPKQGRAAPVEYSDVGSLERVFQAEKPDVVFHVAGATKGVTYDDFQRGNVMPTRNLALALTNAHASVGRFLHVSSLTSYGPSTRDTPHLETNERKPIEHYGKSKLEAELVLERELGASLPWTIIRPGGVFGPHDVDNFELFRLAERRLNVFYGNADSVFSTVFVDDLVRAIRDAASSNSSIGKGYFICDGTPLTWREFQARIIAATGKRAITLHLPQASLDIAATFGELATRFDGKPRLFNRQKVIMGKQVAWTCTHAAAQRDFGYAPRVSLDDAVARTLAFYRAARWL
jgi:nucleoside-diphosphate-sugar epimerase